MFQGLTLGELANPTVTLTTQPGGAMPKIQATFEKNKISQVQPQAMVHLSQAEYDRLTAECPKCARRRQQNTDLVRKRRARG